jgi:hypothetical protein
MQIFHWGVKKGQGKEANHSSAASVMEKNVWSYTSHCPICIHGVKRDKFTSDLTNSVKLTFSLPQNDEWRAKNQL